MRGFPLLAFVLLGVTALAGCSDASDPPAAPEDGPSRTARPGSGIGDVDEAEVEPVELLRVPLRMAGPGPVSFDVAVPENVVAVAFGFTGSATFEAVGLRIDLTGCGGYDNSMGSWGATPGDAYGDLCGPAEAGAQTVTVDGTLVVFDGTFYLTGFVPVAGNETAAAEPQGAGA